MDGTFSCNQYAGCYGYNQSHGVIWNFFIQSSCHFRDVLCIAGIVRESCYSKNNQCDDEGGNRSYHHVADMTEEGACPLRKLPIWSSPIKEIPYLQNKLRK